MRIPFVDLKSQYLSIKDEIDKVLSEVISNAAFVGGAYVKSFEEAFAAFCGVKHCIGVGNGTDALFISLRALGIGRGDEVVTAANSFIATSEAITMSGAKVVFADIDPKTYNIDATKVEEKISKKTKAVIPVHLYGQPADMDPVLDIAKRHHIRVIEDAAQAHGAVYKGRKIGSIGDVGCFSFYPGKNLGAYGDAGAIVTNDDELASKARMISNHGRVEKYNHELEGVNSRLDGVQAAILEVKLAHLPQWTVHRQKNARIYDRNLHNSGLITPAEIDDVQAVYHLYVVRVQNRLRDKLQEYLESDGISTGIHYPITLPNLTAYAYLNHRADDFPMATKASQEILSLPMYPELEESQIAYIAKKIEEFCSREDPGE